MNGGANEGDDPTFPPGFTPTGSAKAQPSEGLVGHEMAGVKEQVGVEEHPSKAALIRSCGHGGSAQDTVNRQGGGSNFNNDGRSFFDVNQFADGDSESVMGPLNEKFGEPFSHHHDSFQKSKPPVDAISWLQRFNEFIEIGQIMGYKMSGCEKDLKCFLKKVGGNEVFQ